MAVTWTTQRSGDWSLVSTDPDSPWYDDDVQSGYARTPGSSGNANFDLVVIANGHALVCDASVTIGDPASPTSLAIRTAGTGGTGTLSIAAGVILTVQSNVQQGNAAWSGTDDFGIVFANATALTWAVSDGSNQTNCVLQLHGSSGSRGSVSSSSAPGSFIRTSNTISIDATYVDFSYVGTSSVVAFNISQNNASSSVLFDHCNFDHCGTVNATSASATNSSTIFRDCNFTNTASSVAVGLSFTNAIGSGTREIVRCRFDKPLGSSTNWRDVRIEYNALGAPISVSSSGANPWVNFSNNYIRQTATATNNIGGPTAQNGWNYWLTHNTSGSQLSNTKSITLSQALDVHLTGFILDYGNTANNCDAITLPSPSAAHAYVIDQILTLPNASGVSAGKVVSGSGNANVTATIDHCTAVSVGGTETGLLQYGETYRGFAGMIVAVKNSLVWTPDGQTAGYVVQKYQTTLSGTLTLTASSTAVTGSSTQFTSQLAPDDWIVVIADNAAYQVDSIASNTSLTLKTNYAGSTGSGKSCASLVKDVVALADYNAGWQLGTGTDGVGYNGNNTGVAIFSSAPGAHDVTLSSNPFVDSTRNIATWAVHKSVADAGDDYDDKVAAAETLIWNDPQTNIPDLVNWVKAGWSVTAATLEDAGNDGVTIGALPHVDPGTPDSSAAPILFMLAGRAC